MLSLNAILSVATKNWKKELGGVLPGGVNPPPPTGTSPGGRHVRHRTPGAGGSVLPGGHAGIVPAQGNRRAHEAARATAARARRRRRGKSLLGP